MNGMEFPRFRLPLKMFYWPIDMNIFLRFSAFRDQLSFLAWSSDTRKAVTISVGFHVSIAFVIGLSFLSFEKEEEEFIKPNPILSFQLSGPSTESKEENSIPEIAPAASKESLVSVPSDAPVAPIAFVEGGSGNEGRIWTPPPPDYINPPISSPVGVVGSKAPLPTVSFNGIGTDPVLIDYEIGRFEGAEALLEATRLSLNGRIKMTVHIDDTGKPEGCTTVKTSGSNVLDNLGCGLVMTYRYEPALDALNKPKAAVIYEVLEWSSQDAGDNSQLVRPQSGIDNDNDGSIDEPLVSAKQKLDQNGNIIPNSLDGDQLIDNLN